MRRNQHQGTRNVPPGMIRVVAIPDNTPRHSRTNYTISQRSTASSASDYAYFGSELKRILTPDNIAAAMKRQVTQNSDQPAPRSPTKSFVSTASSPEKTPHKSNAT
ncbi:hypothetical protein HNY73_023081 [Argiope bruennichi]|uniref:Uncharacterized protein n=1 Tax=Argiope bruennichi TaxID=94029 RepID=A0A8T0E3T1_ARGBR|nr:hypothetical protein HNY73_023081 [Argiope bruennichi]